MANDLSNGELVALLQRRPKEVEALRTRNAFRKFFAGMDRARLLALLRAAYAGEEACEEKVEKRIRLVEDWCT